MTVINNEVELLLNCSKPQMDHNSADRICRLLQEEEIDWEYTLKAARSHGIFPILYHNLKSIRSEAVPRDALSNLKVAYLFNVGRNLMLTRELLCIIDDFQEHGIEAVPFKGPTLARAAYGDITLRSFSDLDIMVHKHDVLRAKGLLISRGYEPQTKFTQQQEGLHLQNECEYEFTRDGPMIRVEVHWRFLPSRYSVPFDEEIWSRLETMTFEGTTIHSFSPEDLVLALCAHGAKHYWAQMKYLSDLAGLIERYQIDWDQVNTIAVETGLKRILNVSLLLIHDLLDVRIPEQFISEIKTDGTTRKLALDLTERLFAKADTKNAVFESLFWLRTRERLKDKARYLFLLVMEPTKEDMDIISLPNHLFSLYRIIRPARLFYQYGLKKRRDERSAE